MDSKEAREDVKVMWERDSEEARRKVKVIGGPERGASGVMDNCDVEEVVGKGLMEEEEEHRG